MTAAALSQKESVTSSNQLYQDIVKEDFLCFSFVGSLIVLWCSVAAEHSQCWGLLYNGALEG